MSPPVLGHPAGSKVLRLQVTGDNFGNNSSKSKDRQPTSEKASNKETGDGGDI
jgi:hypothetical protein